MSREEFAKLALALKSVYNAPAFMATTEGMTIWYETLKDIPYEICHNAVIAYMATEEKIPMPASIRKKALELAQNEISEMQAWALVSKALRNGTYGAQEEFDKLPDDVKRAVGSADQLHNWAMTDEKTVEGVIQSNFIKTYRTLREREKQDALLPQSVKNTLGLTTGDTKLIEGVQNETGAYRRAD